MSDNLRRNRKDSQTEGNLDEVLAEASVDVVDDAQEPEGAPVLETDSDVAAETATDGNLAVNTADVRWAPEGPIRKGYGGSAVSFAMAGLAASFFVGWAVPLALIGITLGIIAIRKREESTILGVWATGLGVVATLYSAGWLLWAANEMHWFG